MKRWLRYGGNGFGRYRAWWTLILGLSVAAIPHAWPLGPRLLATIVVAGVGGFSVLLLRPGRPTRWYDYVLMVVLFVAVQYSSSLLR